MCDDVIIGVPLYILYCILPIRITTIIPVWLVMKNVESNHFDGMKLYLLSTSNNNNTYRTLIYLFASQCPSSSTFNAISVRETNNEHELHFWSCVPQAGCHAQRATVASIRAVTAVDWHDVTTVLPFQDACPKLLVALRCFFITDGQTCTQCWFVLKLYKTIGRWSGKSFGFGVILLFLLLI